MKLPLNNDSTLLGVAKQRGLDASKRFLLYFYCILLCCYPRTRRNAFTSTQLIKLIGTLLQLSFIIMPQLLRSYLHYVQRKYSDRQQINVEFSTKISLLSQKLWYEKYISICLKLLLYGGKDKAKPKGPIK